MIKKKYIPKGSDVYDDGVLIAKTTRDLHFLDLPMPEHFDPPIPLGTKINLFEMRSNDKVIYRHPNFID